MICQNRGVITSHAAPDATLAGAVDFARAALAGAAEPTDIGAHLQAVDDAEVAGDLVVTHTFECLRAGYVGWRWSVTLTRTADAAADQVTIDEVVLLPGADAIVAPAWLPYKDRVRPGDLGPGDLLPVEDEDPRLVPTYSAGDEEDLSSDEVAQIKQVAGELYLDRVRTLSIEGRELAADRWYASDRGPESALAKAAPQTCISCGFMVRLAGPLAETFGVCANGNANDDGQVVSLNHGCGAHSEVKLARKQRSQPLPPPVVDTLTDDVETF